MLIAVLVPCLAFAPQTLGAEKLNAPLDFRIVLGDVEALDASANGEWIAYSAHQEESTIGLYVVKSDGSFGPVRISPPGSDLRRFELNRLGTRVVFQTDDRTLIVADQTGGLTQLNPPLANDRAIQSFGINANGFYAVYLADQEVDERRDLYSVPVHGAPIAVKLAESVYDYRFAADGARVLLIAPQSGGPLRLYSVPVNASTVPALLSQGITNGYPVGHSPAPETTPNGARAIFVVDTSGKRELYSSTTDGLTLAVRLSGPIVAGGDVEDFRIAPAGNRVVYRADALVNGLQELFSVPSDGSAPPVAISAGRDPVGAFAISPDGTTVVFEAEVRGRVFSVPIDGRAAPLQLSNQGGSGGVVLGVRDLEVSSDGTHAVYVVDDSDFFTDELHGVRIDGSAPEQLLYLVPNPNERLGRRITLPDGDLLFLSGGLSASSVTLHRVPVDGTQAPLALHSSSIGRSGTADDFVLAGNSVVFRSDLEERQRTELFRVPTDASAPPARLNGELHWTRGFDNVAQIGVSADGRHAAYATAGGIHTLALAAPGTATTVATPGSDPFLGIDFASQPARFTYRALVPTGRQLFSAPFDGSSPPQQLSTGTWALPFGVVGQSIAGPWLVYSTSGYFGAEPSYFLRADGSSAPSLLEGPYVLSVEANAAGTQLLYRYQAVNPFFVSPKQLFLRDPLAGPSFEVAPLPGFPAYPPQALAASFSGDGARVVFVRDQEGELRFELFSVLSVAGALPVKLSGSLPAEGDVAAGFALTPDATRVVFAADRDLDEARQLFVSPLDGSAAPLELSPALAAGESVALDAAGVPLVWISRDSTRALFVLAGTTRQLLSVPLDGSAPAVAVGPLPVLGAGLPLELGAVALTRDGRNVVFRAALSAPDPFELFAAPVAGGPGIRLAATASSAQDVEPGFIVLRSGREVLFRGDLGQDERQELWLVPVDGSRPPRRVSALGPHDADVEPDFVLAADENHVYYRADAENDGELEFFRHPLRTPAVRPR